MELSQSLQNAIKEFSPEGQEWITHRVHQEIDRGNAVSPDDLSLIKDWFNDSLTEEHNFGNKFYKITFKQAMDAQKKWHEYIARKNKAVQHDDIDTILIKDYTDTGHKLVQIVTHKGLEYEGHVMSHCVSSYSLDEYDIFSLRDASNKSLITISFYKNTSVFNQSRGFANQTPSIDDLRVILSWMINEKNVSLSEFYREREHIVFTKPDNDIDIIKIEKGVVNLSKIPKGSHIHSSVNALISQCKDYIFDDVIIDCYERNSVIEDISFKKLKIVAKDNVEHVRIANLKAHCPSPSVTFINDTQIDYVTIDANTHMSLDLKNVKSINIDTRNMKENHVLKINNINKAQLLNISSNPESRIQFSNCDLQALTGPFEFFNIEIDRCKNIDLNEKKAFSLNINASDNVSLPEKIEHIFYLKMTSSTIKAKHEIHVFHSCFLTRCSLRGIRFVAHDFSVMKFIECKGLTTIPDVTLVKRCVELRFYSCADFNPMVVLPDNKDVIYNLGFLDMKAISVVNTNKNCLLHFYNTMFFLQNDQRNCIELKILKIENIANQIVLDNIKCHQYFEMRDCHLKCNSIMAEEQITIKIKKTSHIDARKIHSDGGITIRKSNEAEGFSISCDDISAGHFFLSDFPDLIRKDYISNGKGSELWYSCKKQKKGIISHSDLIKIMGFDLEQNELHFYKMLNMDMDNFNKELLKKDVTLNVFRINATTGSMYVPCNIKLKAEILSLYIQNRSFNDTFFKQCDAKYRFVHPDNFMEYDYNACPCNQKDSHTYYEKGMGVTPVKDENAFLDMVLQGPLKEKPTPVKIQKTSFWYRFRLLFRKDI